MERVSQESDGFFSVSLAERGDEVKSHDKRNPSGVDGFFLNALGMEPPAENEYSSFTADLVQPRAYKRLDPDYYHPERMDALRALNAQSDNVRAARLDEVVSFEREQLKTPTENYLSLAHIQPGTGEVADVSDTASGNCFAFQADNVLFARLRPYLNKVHRAETGGCCSIEFHVLRVKKTSELLPEYLAVALRSSLTLAQTVHMMTGNTHPRLTDDDVRGLIVPIPDMAIQKSIADEAHARRENSRRLHAEADALMKGVDDFVMDALGISPPARDARKAFAVNFAGLGGEARLDSDYYHPERMEALRALSAQSGDIAVARLSEVARSEREQVKSPTQNYLSLAHVQSDTGELSDAADTASGSCLVFRADDVLFARLRPYLNKVHRAERGGCCSTEFHVLRVRDRSALLPEYLAAALRSRVLLSQTVHMMTGNTHPRLTNEDVANLMIPIPSVEIQRRIAAEITRRRDTARNLRAEAEAGWQSAKRRFERRLLGGEGAQ